MADFNFLSDDPAPGFVPAALPARPEEQPVSAIPDRPATWGDVGHGLMAGVHGLEATGAGFAASISGDRSDEMDWRRTAQEQQQAAEASSAAMTPGVQPGWGHPMVAAAEMVPGMVPYAAAAATGPFAPVAMAAVGAAQTRGGFYNRVTGQGIEPTTSQLTGATALGAATGLAMEAVPELAGKVPTSKLAQQALGMTGDAVTFGGSGAAEEYTGQKAEIDAAKRQAFDINAVLGAGVSDAEMGAGFGLLPKGVREDTAKPKVGGTSGAQSPDQAGSAQSHGPPLTADQGGAPAAAVQPDMHRAPTGGVSAAPTRSSREGRKPEVTQQGGKPPAPGGAKEAPSGPAAPPSPVADPSIARGLTGEPIVPGEEGRQIYVHPRREAPPAEAAAPEPQVPQPDVTRGVTPEQAPSAEAAPEAPPTAPETPPLAMKEPEQIIPESEESLRQQHADLTNPDSPRVAMVYNPGMDAWPVPAKLKPGKFATRKLDDGRIIQYDKTKTSGAKIAAADKAGTLGEDILKLGSTDKDQAIQDAVAGRGQPAAVMERTPEGTVAKSAAGTTATAPEQAAAFEASKTPGNVVSVEPPEQAVAERTAPLEVTPRVTPAGSRTAETDPELARIKAEMNARLAASVPSGRVLADLSPEAPAIRATADEAQRQQTELQKTVAQQLKERQKAREQATGVKEKKPRKFVPEIERPQEGKHYGATELEQMKGEGAAADKIAAEYSSDGNEPAGQTFSRAQAMLRDAHDQKVSIPREAAEHHSAGQALLMEARDFINRSKKYPDDKMQHLGTFLDREAMLRKGDLDQWRAVRRAEGAEASAIGTREASETKEIPDEVTGREGVHEPGEGREGAAEAGEEAAQEAPEGERAYTVPKTRAAPVVVATQRRFAGKLKSAESDAELAAYLERLDREAMDNEDLTHLSHPDMAAINKRMEELIAEEKAEDAKRAARPGAVKTLDEFGNETHVNPSETITAREAIARHLKLRRYPRFIRPMIQTLAERILQVAGDTKVHYITDKEMRRVAGDEGTTFGFYQDTEGYEHIMLNADKTRHDTALHEVFHAATAKAVRADLKLRDDIQKLMEEVEDRLPSPRDVSSAIRQKMLYAFQNPDEFITGIMTNPHIQNLIKKTPISDQLARDFELLKWRKKTIWNAVVHLISKAFGLGPKYFSVIEATMALSERAMSGVEQIKFPERWQKPEGLQESAKPARMFQRDMDDTPEEAGDRIERGVRNVTRRVTTAAKDMIANGGAGMVTKGLKALDLPKLYDVGKELFQSKNEHGKTLDPMRDYVDAAQRRGPRADELSERGHELATQLRTLANKHGNDVMDKAEQVRRIMNEFGVYPHHELGEGMNAHLGLAKKQKPEDAAIIKRLGRGAHARLTDLWGQLPDDVQSHILEEERAAKQRFNQMAEMKAKAYIESVAPPEGHTTEDILQRMQDGRLSDEDDEEVQKIREHYADRGVKHLDADDFQKRKGPYFKPERNGDIIVEADHKVAAPGDSGMEYTGALLPANVRRFDDLNKASDFGDSTKLPYKINTKYFLQDSDGNRHYTNPESGKRVTHDEAASSGYTLKHDYYVDVQHEWKSWHKTMGDANRAREALARDGLINISAPQDRRGRGVDVAMTGVQTRGVIRDIQRRKDLSDTQKDQLIDSIKETATLSQNGSRIMKNFVQSQKVQGAQYRGDGIAEYFQSSGRHMAMMEALPKLNQALEDMHAVAKFPERKGDASHYTRTAMLNELEGRMANKVENLYGTSPILQKVMNMAYIYDMASASHLLTHQINLHYMGGSVIGARHGVLQTFGAFNKIMREAGGPWMAAKHGFGAAWQHMKDPESTGVSMFDMMRNSVTNARERNAVDGFLATGHIPKDASGFDLPPIGESRTATSRVSRFIQDSSASMDIMGRFVTGLAAYRMEYAKLADKGLSLSERHEQAMLYARTSIEKGLTHYGVGMRAPWMSSPLMRAMSQFRLPGINMLYLYGRNAYLAFRHSDIQTRNEAYRTIGALLLGGWALSGSSALPTEPLKMLGILGNALGVTPAPSKINDELRRGLAGALGPSIANVLLDGPLSMAGPYAPSFAHRVASPELSFGEPRSGKPDDVLSWLAGLSIGAGGTFGVNVARGSQAMFSGDYANAARYLTPKLLADAAKAYGIYQKGEPGAIPESAMQAFGVRSQSIVRQQEGKSALYNRMQEDKAAKSAAIKSGINAVLKWNAANPMNKISRAEMQAAGHPSKTVLGLKVQPKNLALAQEYGKVYQ